MNKIIGVCGTKCVGKDTFYKLLDKKYPNKFVRFAFADELKNDLFELVRDQWGLDVKNLSGNKKESIRPLLIGYGCSWRNIDPLHWVKEINKKLIIL